MIKKITLLHIVVGITICDSSIIKGGDKKYTTKADAQLRKLNSALPRVLHGYDSEDDPENALQQTMTPADEVAAWLHDPLNDYEHRSPAQGDSTLSLAPGLQLSDTVTTNTNVNANVTTNANIISNSTVTQKLAIRSENEQVEEALGRAKARFAEDAKNAELLLSEPLATQIQREHALRERARDLRRAARPDELRDAQAEKEHADQLAAIRNRPRIFSEEEKKALDTAAAEEGVRAGMQRRIMYDKIQGPLWQRVGIEIFKEGFKAVIPILVKEAYEKWQQRNKKPLSPEEEEARKADIFMAFRAKQSQLRHQDLANLKLEGEIISTLLEMPANGAHANTIRNDIVHNHTEKIELLTGTRQAKQHKLQAAKQACEKLAASTASGVTAPEAD